jgi:hypothetical protein
MRFFRPDSRGLLQLLVLLLTTRGLLMPLRAACWLMSLAMYCHEFAPQERQAGGSSTASNSQALDNKEIYARACQSPRMQAKQYENN